MSKQTVCDVHKCENEAKNHEVTYCNIEVVPTGNSDYSAEKVATIKRSNADLCKEHWEQYKTRIGYAFSKSEEVGFWFPEPKEKNE